MSVKKRDNLSISPWICRFSGLIAETGTVLDLAAGGGRHSHWLLGQGFDVTALDRRIDALQAMREAKPKRALRLEVIQTDLENGSPWPLAERRFDAIVVVNYLWRPLFPKILAALDAGGVLLYETFAVGHEVFGKPSNPDFLLKPGELLDIVASHLTVVAYEHGQISSPTGPAIKQRIVATARPTPSPLPPS